MNITKGRYLTPEERELIKKNKKKDKIYFDYFGAALEKRRKNKYKLNSFRYNINEVIK